MSLRIPNDFVSGFQDLANLSINEVQKIASVISTIPAGTGPQKFKSSLSSSITDLDFSQLSPMIFSFGNIMLNAEDNSNENISRMLCEALPNSSDLDKKQIEEKKLEEKLNIILQSTDNIKFTYKANDLIFDNHINYKKGRIFSDIRLLFDDEIETNSNDRKAVIIHRLKLESSKNDEDKNYYFSLDSKDLNKLKELIDRAISKEETIKSDYPNINFIELTE